MKGAGFSLKNWISKTAYGLGRLYFYNWLYKPVFGDLKSGIPEATLKPAPVKTTTFLNFFYFNPLITSS